MISRLPQPPTLLERRARALIAAQDETNADPDAASAKHAEAGTKEASYLRRREPMFEKRRRVGPHR